MEEDNQDIIKDLTEEEKKDLEEFFKKIKEEGINGFCKKENVILNQIILEQVKIDLDREKANEDN